ncbi:MAG: hypothetical protein RR532_04705 [Erysipelothrix sp.]
MKEYQNQLNLLQLDNLSEQELIKLKFQQHQIMLELLPYFQVQEAFRKKTNFETTNFRVMDEEDSLDMVKQVSLIDDTHFGVLYLSGVLKIYKINGLVLENMILPFYEGRVLGMMGFNCGLECYTNKSELLRFEIITNENIKVIETESVNIVSSEVVKWGQDIIFMSPQQTVYLNDLKLCLSIRDSDDGYEFDDEVSDRWSAITCDDSYVYIATQDGLILVYSIKDNFELHHQVRLFESSITSINLLDPNQLIALGDLGQCIIINVDTFESRRIEGMTGHLYTVIANRDEALILNDEGETFLLERFFDEWTLNPWIKLTTDIVLGTHWQDDFIVQDLDGIWQTVSINKLRDYQTLFAIDLYK